MTHGEWLDCTPDYLSFTLHETVPRKARLLAAALCRHFHWMMDLPEVAEAVDVIETFADTGRSKAALRRARQSIQQARDRFTHPDAVWQEFVRWALFMVQVAAAEYAVTGTLRTAREIHMRQNGLSEEGAWRELFRPATCIIGNPFRPVAFDPAWRSESAVALAIGIYADRAFDRLLILADALEEAGCDHPDVLAHCRDPHQPHARGCWVVDLVLGKS